MATPKKLIFIDTETTGLNPDNHEIIELGAIVAEYDPETKMLVEKEIIDLKIKPEHIETAEAIALRINGYNEADWIFAVDLKSAMQKLQKVSEGGIMIAHNMAFDYLFLEHAFRKTGVENKMHYHKIDTISVAFAKLGGVDDIGKYSMYALCDRFGIKNQKAHSAYSDTRALFELFQKLMSL